MLNIVCVQAGNYCERGAQYVNVLYDQVCRNLPEGHTGRFVCFTDDPSGLDQRINVRTLPAGLNGWWAKLYLFSPAAFAAGEEILYFDLDTLIVGPLDAIASYRGDLAMLRDFYQPSRQASGVMAWKAGKHAEIWENWCAAGQPRVEGGDQAWIESIVPDIAILQDEFPGLIVSYKVHCRPLPPRGASIVCFHGLPRPHNAAEAWVDAVWKVGGGLSSQIVVESNTAAEIIERNITLNARRDVPWLGTIAPHDGAVVICGGGPSLSGFIGEIALRQKAGQFIVALNGSYNYMVERGVIPDAVIVLDARPENIEFVTALRSGSRAWLASQCDPSLFDALPGAELWHPAIDGVFDFLPPGRAATAVGGGVSVGIMAMSLLHMRGFRRLHLYGDDSSYLNGENHAYPQVLNSGEKTLEAIVGERKFLTSGWMVRQVNDFLGLVRVLIDLDSEVHVYGDGLLPHTARCVASRQPSNTHQKEQ